MIYTDLIYDFDGTIADSYPAFTEALLVMLERYGISDTYEHALSLLKVSVKNALESYDLGLDIKAARVEFRDIRNPIMMENAKPMAGAETLLRFVKVHGGRNYIYTHSPNYIWSLLEKWGLRDYFEGGVTADDDFPTKPAPDALNFICAKYGIDREKCLMIGDRDIDIEAGKNAGIKGVLLDPDGFYRDYSTEFSVSTLPEIIKLIQ